MWFIGVEVEQETSAPPPKKNPGSAPASQSYLINMTSRMPRDRERHLLTSEGNYQSDTEKTVLCI